MVELLAAGLTGERFSYEAKQHDNGDGGPPRGGEMVIALSPELIAGAGWESHVEDFMDRLTGLDGVRIPGARRHQNRLDTGPRAINATLVETIRELI
jgi:delta1-piperideine-2-carboxylate reductase